MSTELTKNSLSFDKMEKDLTVLINNDHLSIEDVVNVSRYGYAARITEEEDVLGSIQASVNYIEHAVAEGKPIYGVTSGFGGMANVTISSEQAVALQRNLVAYHKAGAGKRLSNADVRAAMLLRIKSHMKGVSGIRLALIRRMEIFLNENVTPYVHEFGSIGASGDLTPLSYITGCIAGLSEDYRVDFDGEELNAIEALGRLGLEPLSLRPKEGLAMMNGTSVMTGIAANCVHDSKRLLRLTMGAHALIMQGLHGTNQSFHPFIHDHCKPHEGQKWAATSMLRLLEGSKLIRDELDGSHNYRGDQPIQDRYSMRCLAQFIGPVFEGIEQIARQVEVEMNAATDNPLIDVRNNVAYHGGNFLGQHIGIAMDQLRYYQGLLSKHLDTQIALLVAPEFSNGLPASLVGNSNRSVNMGLKAVQITANSLMPLLSFYGNSLVDRFPTHAEQFNQNINSQGFGSANLARRSVEIFQQYLSIALMFGIQAVDLRTRIMEDHYDATDYLSPATRELYLAVKNVIGSNPSRQRPFLWDDSDRNLDFDIAAIAMNITNGNTIMDTVKEI
ncbi:aromatic amino acid ammonia-lyase [Fulvivirgaceae bacterium BMA12]|uniref:Aromatic amino acid ammonia-lyase n=1 Tax=Agaribacillus aureus TaxID=3051825 RepID=A0ABT8L7X7_9BACT|nr:aromatic amino acid ammonia-lyase [Fulvivirgaceae bacterium BMA12]